MNATELLLSAGRYEAVAPACDGNALTSAQRWG